MVIRRNRRAVFCLDERDFIHPRLFGGKLAVFGFDCGIISEETNGNVRKRYAVLVEVDKVGYNSRFARGNGVIGDDLLFGSAEDLNPYAAYNY